MAGKRRYEEKLSKRLAGHESFLLERLRREWDTIERSKRHNDLLDMTKYTGATVGRALLVIAALGAVVAVTAVAPNIFSAFGRIGGHRRFFTQRSIRDQLGYLKRRKYVSMKQDAGDEPTEIRLTAFGKRAVIARAFGDLKIMPQKTWDGKWRVVVFDIPDKHKWAREGLREKLKCMGFYRMQKSVFAFPYPCEEEIIFLTDIYSIGRYVRLIETYSIAHDGDIRKYFAFDS